MTPTYELKFLTRKFPLLFEGNQAITTVNVEQLRAELKEGIELASDRPVSVSVTEEHLLVTFQVLDKREPRKIGFR